MRARRVADPPPCDLLTMVPGAALANYSREPRAPTYRRARRADPPSGSAGRTAAGHVPTHDYQHLDVRDSTASIRYQPSRRA